MKETISNCLIASQILTIFRQSITNTILVKLLIEYQIFVYLFNITSFLSLSNCCFLKSSPNSVSLKKSSDDV